MLATKSLKNINSSFEDLDELDKLDNLDILDCSTYFQNIYDKVVNKNENKDEQTNPNDSKCPTCFSSEFIEDISSGYIICECGQVISNIYDYRSEIRIYDEDSKTDNLRCNKITNVLLPQSSLGTRLPSNIRGSLKKLQAWSAMPYRERSLYNDFKKINICCEKLGFKKNIQESANIYYSIAKSCKYIEGANTGKFIITRGKNNRGIQAGSICISCKKNNTPFIAKDICEYFKLNIKELNNGVKNILELLKVKRFDIDVSSLKSESYIKKYCMDLNVKEELMNEAIKISRNINKLNLASEHNQFSIATTSMLIMGEINNIPTMNKKKLREMFGVSEVTISKTYKKLEKVKHILNNDKEVERIMANMKKDQEIEEEIEPIILERMKKFNIKPSGEMMTLPKIQEEEIKTVTKEKVEKVEKIKSNKPKVKIVISTKEKEKEKNKDPIIISRK
jgi:transcription initiation factor TFIIIB Brf1 subunit/transcription initiation factor TFIIB